MIRMYPKAAVLTAHHPFGGTEMMAQSLAFALNANGYDTRVVNMSDASLQGLPRLLQDPDLRLVMTTGTLPLAIRLGELPVWRAVGPRVQFVTYVIDAWPYDFVRVAPMREFLQAWPSTPNLHLASLEGHDARLIGERAHHMPTGAYPAPWRTGPREHDGRLMIWASANKELSVTPIHGEFEATLRDNDSWGFDAARIRSIGETLRHTRIVHGLSAIADAIGLPLAEAVAPQHLTALCALDSCLKRHRRVKVVNALRGMPVDIYGENWGPYVGDEASFRLLTPDPNHNHAFSYLVQHYSGLVNFDPNFGDGTNERAVSALAMGVPIANNRNLTTDGLAGVHVYDFDDASIRAAADRVLAHAEPVPTPVGNTWEHLVGGLLRGIGAEAAAVAAMAAAGVPPPARRAGSGGGALARLAGAAPATTVA